MKQLTMIHVVCETQRQVPKKKLLDHLKLELISTTASYFDDFITFIKEEFQYFTGNLQQCTELHC